MKLQALFLILLAVLCGLSTAAFATPDTWVELYELDCGPDGTDALYVTCSHVGQEIALESQCPGDTVPQVTHYTCSSPAGTVATTDTDSEVVTKSDLVIGVGLDTGVVMIPGHDGSEVGGSGILSFNLDLPHFLANEVGLGFSVGAGGYIFESAQLGVGQALINLLLGLDEDVVDLRIAYMFNVLGAGDSTNGHLHQGRAQLDFSLDENWELGAYAAGGYGVMSLPIRDGSDGSLRQQHYDGVVLQGGARVLGRW